MHVEDAAERFSDDGEFERPALHVEEVDSRLRELQHIQEVFRSFHTQEKSFVQSLVNVPTRVKDSERQRVLEEFDYRPLYEECSRLSSEFEEHRDAIERAGAEIENLEFFRGLPFGPSQLRALRRTHGQVGSMPVQEWNRLRADAEAAELLAFQELRRNKRRVDLCVIALRNDREEAERILRGHQFSERPLPELEGSAADRIDELRLEVARRRRAADQCAERARKLSEKGRQVEILLGHYEARLAKLEAHNKMVRSRRIAILCGFIRAADVAKFEEALERDFPDVSALYREPTPEDTVPISLRHSRLVKPLRFMVDLFGLPDYFSFDPTPYLSLSFLVFFGICFSDVAYGLLLCAVAWYLARKARGYEGLHNMCMLFFYCGISTIFFGVLTGSWAADLWNPDYLGEGNVLLWIKERTAIVEPLDKAVALLLVCLGIGVVNQLYGIVLKGYGLLRRGDVSGAVFDAGFWLVTIPGFMIVASVLFFAIPGWLFRLGVGLVAVGGVGLVLTQGRHEKGVAAKALVGLVSLYGIMGSYGCISFMADMLSYSRLLALGLTTSIVGMSFNILAGLVQDIPRVGVVLFIGVALMGHLFNFAVGIISAFVHPARLIFLEFFNRFYEMGGVRFSPLSLNTETVIVER